MLYMDKENIWHHFRCQTSNPRQIIYTSADLFMSFLMPLKSRKILNEPAFELLLYKANSFHFAIVCLVIDAQKTSERGKSISDTLDSVTRIGHILPRCDDICASITEQTTAKWKLFVK